MADKEILHYRIVEELGRGGMGVVYKAHDTKLDRLVALKFLPQHLTTDSNEKERFYQEARAAAALSHPNVTVIHEIGEHEGQLFIAMEYVEGRTLKQLVEKESESLSVRKVLDISSQICDGLAAAHEKGIVHRDIKSDNIMLTQKGQVKIMDFGLAKLKGGSKLTEEGSTLGTAAYMSPEQAQGEDVDQRSDIFSFGVVLYELLTAHLPFRGEHQAALLYSVVNEDPQPVARYNDKVSGNLERIVRKALAKEKEERYQHIDDLLADLRSERKNLEYVPKTAASEPGKTERVAVGAPGRKKRALVFGTSGILVIALAVIGYFFLSNEPNAAENTKPAGKSIAVLPFANDSGDPKEQYFSDGLSESLIIALSQYPTLTVIGRESSFHLRHTTLDSRQIGRLLGVATLLEGSVSHEGDEVRVRTELVSAVNGRTLWSDQYDRPYKNLFALQDDITKAVAAALKAKLLGNASTEAVVQTDRPPSGSLTAYNAFLEGNFYVSQFTEASLHKAVHAYEQAIHVDPKYAAAYAELSYTWTTVGAIFAGARSATTQAYSKARPDVSTALKLDPELATAHVARGVLLVATLDWRSAEAAFRRALRLAPGNAVAKRWLAVMLATLGRLDSAVSLGRTAVAANPLDADAYYALARLLAGAGKLTAAEQTIDRAISLEPTAGTFHALLAEIEVLRGNSKIALQAALAEPSPAWRSWALALAYRSAGEASQADQMLKKLTGVYANIMAYQIAQVYAYRGDADQAFAWLDRAWQQRDPGVHLLLYDPFLLRYKTGPRLAAFCRKVGLPAPDSTNAVTKTRYRHGDPGTNTRSAK